MERRAEQEGARKKLEAATRRPIHDALWEDLVETGYVSDYLKSEKIAPLAERYRRLEERMIAALGGAPGTGARMLARTHTPKAQKRNQRAPTSLREEALSRLVARAARNRQLLNFRKRLLGDRLLEPDQVERWLHEQIVRELSSNPAPTDARRKGKSAAGGSDTPARTSPSQGKAVTLDYFDFDIGRPVSRSVPAGGQLENLSRLSHNLAERYWWLPAQATAFVLTDLVPLIRSVSIESQPRTPTSLSRIEMRIDPVVTPDQLAERYRDYRRTVMTGRLRLLSEKHLSLAAFVAGRPVDENREERMAAWNMAVRIEAWKYSNVATFRRDCTQAERRLLDPAQLRAQTS